MPKVRTEQDSLGKYKVPINAYYGVFTQRALDNFPISGIKAPTEFLHALLYIKIAAAQANMKLGILDKKLGNAIVKAAKEALRGKFSADFLLDVFQAGAGTPFNMNVNEVLANRANELLRSRRGTYKPVHPNDHVNMCQSSNDVVPTAIRVAALWRSEKLLENLATLEKTFHKKAAQFRGILKSARTHYRDAVPVTLGQEFAAYAANIAKHRRQLAASVAQLREVPLGGTAIGTGLNAYPRFANLATSNLSKLTRLRLNSAANKMEPLQFTSDFLTVANCIAAFSADMLKICRDLMLYSSGPSTGLGEIVLPAVEPGSSIMPGKVNPSMPELMAMVCQQCLGNRLVIENCSADGQFELNVKTPVVMYNLLQMLDISSNACKAFAKDCVKGIKADKAACTYYFEHSKGFATILAPKLGYTKTAELVKEAIKSGKTFKQLVREKNLLSEKELKSILRKSLGASRL